MTTLKNFFISLIHSPLWESVQFCGLLLIITLAAFILRSRIIQIFLRIITLNQPLRSRKLWDTFAGPLELIFVGIVALMTTKILPNPNHGNGLHNFILSVIMISAFWTAYRATTAYSWKLQKVYNALDTHLSKDLIKLITNALKACILLVGVFTILDLWGINVAALMGGLGILSAAIAFASQDTFKNIFGSVAILLDQTFAIGDRVVIDSVDGTVEDIGLRSTVIRRSDQALISIPNGNIVNIPVINFSRVDHRIVSFSLYVDLRSKAKNIEAFVTDLKQHIPQQKWYQKHVKTSPLLVYADNIGTSGFVITVRFFINKTDFESVCLVKESCLLYARDRAQKHELFFYQDKDAAL